MLGKASEIISITTMVKDGGYESLKIPPHMIGNLSKGIKDKGVEIVHLSGGKSLEIVGFIVTGSMTGERIIVSGSEAKEDE